MRKFLISVTVLASAAASQATPLMSTDWAAAACQEWNKTPTLTDGLVGKVWLGNDAGRGYKIIQMYRNECGAASKVELKIVPQDGKAMCIYGGQPATPNFDAAKDYVMYAPTLTWNEMGAGKYGPKSGMVFRGFRFDGSMSEAMGVMGAFEAFVLIPGKVPGEAECPKG